MSNASLPPRHVTPRGPTLTITKLVVFGAAGVVILVCIVYALIRFRNIAAETREAERKADAQAQAAASASAAVNEAKKVTAEQELANIKAQAAADQLKRLEQLRLTEYRLDQVIHRGQKISANIDRLQEDIDTVAKTQNELLTGDLGKRIAANRKAVEQYCAIVGKAAPDSVMPKRLREAVEGLLEPFRQAKTVGAADYTLNEQMLTELAVLERQVDDALQAWDARNSRLSSLLHTAPATAPADTPTLQEALKQLENERAAETNHVEAEYLDKVRRQEDQKTAALKAKLDADQAAAERDAMERVARAKEASTRALGKIKADEIEAQTQALVSEAQARTARQAEEARKAKLEHEFEADLPEIQRLLRGLISEGATQPGGPNGLFAVTTKRGPVSYAALGRIGALEPTIKSQQKLYFSVGTSGNDRDRGSFPDYFGGDSDWRRKAATVQRAQELLIKYGPLMVEKKILAP